MIEPICEHFNRWKQAEIPVTTVRCDNTDENIKLQKRCSSVDWKLGIDFKYTSRDTPQ